MLCWQHKWEGVWKRDSGGWGGGGVDAEERECKPPPPRRDGLAKITENPRSWAGSQKTCHCFVIHR